MLDVQGYEKEECNAIFKEMRVAAINALKASEQTVPGFFSVVLKPQEKELALLIQQEDTVKLLEWMKNVACRESKLNSAPAYSNSAPVA